MSEYAREFGKHVRSLRRARGVTQDALAQRSGLSADTIRRIEHGSFSASIDTLRIETLKEVVRRIETNAKQQTDLWTVGGDVAEVKQVLDRVIAQLQASFAT